MDVAQQVAELLLENKGTVCIFCKPDCADTICAYGILKLLLFHCCRDTISYTDCISDEILLHNIQDAQQRDLDLFFFINCCRRKSKLLKENLQDLSKAVILDCRTSQRRIARTLPDEAYLLGGTEEEILNRIYDCSVKMKVPKKKYHGTPAALSAYHICTSMTPSFQHPNALWRAIVGCADVTKRKLIHEDQYFHIHEYFTRQVELSEATARIKYENKVESLWDSLHMSPHLFEKFEENGFQDFVANTLGYPQHIADYSYYQFITGPGEDIWQQLQDSGNSLAVQDFVFPGFERKIREFQIHSMDHALAVNVALSVLRAKQYQEESFSIHNIFKGAEEVLGKPQELVPVYIQHLRSDCQKKRQKVQSLRKLS